MQHDELIWRSVGMNFCSFKEKTVKQTFCRNKYNLTGLCSRLSCPLANSRYGTIIEHDGKLVLYVKTVERAHSPRALWEKIKLSPNYRKALAQIDKHMEYWPGWYIHKAKQRLTKMTQYLLRKRRLELRSKTRLVGVKKKVSRREAVREKKAVVAAKVETAIEKELLDRLRSGTYGDIYNFPHEQYEKALDEEAGLLEEEEEEEDEMDEEFSGEEYEALMDDEDESEEEVADMEDGDTAKDDGSRFDFDDFSDEEDEDNGDEQEKGGERDQKDTLSILRARAKKRGAAKRASKGGKGKKGRRARRGVEIEYEREDQEQRVLETTD